MFQVAVLKRTKPADPRRNLDSGYSLFGLRAFGGILLA
jgi:hypothetical protein